MTTETPAPAEALSLTFFSGDLNQDITVQGYLQRLLSDLWQKEESFNGKRPFGNSGWQWEVYGALIEAGHIPGEIDEDGCIEDVDEQAGEAFVLSLIGQMGTAALARAKAAEAEVQRLREAAQRLVDEYWCNKGTGDDFIVCKTYGHNNIPDYWRDLDAALAGSPS